MTEDFNLRAVIRDVCDNAVDLNLHKLVAETEARIRPEDRHAALLQALPLVVDDVIGKIRTHTRISTDAGERAGDAQDELQRKRSARSSKVSGIREHWRRALLEMHSVNRSGDLKRLGDLNRDDLLFNIHAREEVARRNTAKALQFRGLLDLVTRHDVERVADLPEPVLAATLVRSA